MPIGPPPRSPLPRGCQEFPGAPLGSSKPIMHGAAAQPLLRQPDLDLPRRRRAAPVLQGPAGSSGPARIVAALELLRRRLLQPPCRPLPPGLQRRDRSLADPAESAFSAAAGSFRAGGRGLLRGSAVTLAGPTGHLNPRPFSRPPSLGGLLYCGAGRRGSPATEGAELRAGAGHSRGRAERRRPAPGPPPRAERGVWRGRRTPQPRLGPSATLLPDRVPRRAEAALSFGCRLLVVPGALRLP